MARPVPHRAWRGARDSPPRAAGDVRRRAEDAREGSVGGPRARRRRAHAAARRALDRDGGAAPPSRRRDRRTGRRSRVHTSAVHDSGPDRCRAVPGGAGRSCRHPHDRGVRRSRSRGRQSRREPGRDPHDRVQRVLSDARSARGRDDLHLDARQRQVAARSGTRLRPPGPAGVSHLAQSGRCETHRRLRTGRDEAGGRDSRRAPGCRHCAPGTGSRQASVRGPQQQDRHRRADVESRLAGRCARAGERHRAALGRVSRQQPHGPGAARPRRGSCTSRATPTTDARCMGPARGSQHGWQCRSGDYPGVSGRSGQIRPGCVRMDRRRRNREKYPDRRAPRAPSAWPPATLRRAARTR